MHTLWTFIVASVACVLLLLFADLPADVQLIVVTSYLALIAGNQAVKVSRNKTKGGKTKKPKPPKGPTTARMIHLALLFPVVVSQIGCSGVAVGGSREDAGRQYRGQGNVTNYLTTETADGAIAIQDYAGEPPAAVVASDAGVENYGAVPFGTVTAVFPGGTRLIASVPNDFDAEALKVTLPDGTQVDAAGLRVSSSAVVIARAQFVSILAPVLQSMTEGQRAAALAELETQAKLGDAVVQGALPILKAMVGSP